MLKKSGPPDWKSRAGKGLIAAMEPMQDIERRLLELEVKSSFSDDLLEQLNQIIVRQQQQIDRLQREVADLRQQAPEGAAPFRSLRDELPPHY